MSDTAFGESRRQLAYKATWYGTELLVADRWFPSSRTRSTCGTIKAEMPLSDRAYGCSACGLVLDQDTNAAINLARNTAPPATTPPQPTAA